MLSSFPSFPNTHICDRVDDTDRKMVYRKIYVISRLGRFNRQNKILGLNCFEEMSDRLKKASLRFWHEKEPKSETMRLNDSLKDPGLTEIKNNENAKFYLKLQLCKMY